MVEGFVDYLPLFCKKVKDVNTKKCVKSVDSPQILTSRVRRTYLFWFLDFFRRYLQEAKNFIFILL